MQKIIAVSRTFVSWLRGSGTIAALMIAAMAGGLMQGATQPVAVALALDGVTSTRVLAHLTLSTASKLILGFSSGQEYDAAIVNSAGKEVYRWSAGKMFAQTLHNVELTTEQQWVVDTSPTPALAPGKYSLQVWLTVTGQPAKAYSASLPFEVAP